MPPSALSLRAVVVDTPAGREGPFDFELAAGEIGLLRLEGSRWPRRLLEVVAGLRAPHGGIVAVGGEELHRHRSAALARMAYLPTDHGYDPLEPPDRLLRRVRRWRRVAGSSESVARERYERWMGEGWPRAPLGTLDALRRLAVRIAVARLHDPLLLLLDAPLDDLDPDGRPAAARWLARGAAEGLAILLRDGTGEAVDLADRLLPSPPAAFWVSASFEGSIAALERQSVERALPGRWWQGQRGGACRLGPFEEEQRAREAARWLLTEIPHPRQLRLEGGASA